MTLSKEQITNLLGLVSSTNDDCIDCSGCYDRIAEFADSQLSGKALCEAMRAVKSHLEACRCCADEYQALMEGLKALEDDACS